MAEWKLVKAAALDGYTMIGVEQYDDLLLVGNALAARLRQAEEERDAWRHLAARYYSNQWLDRQAAIDRDFRALAASSAGDVEIDSKLGGAA